MIRQHAKGPNPPISSIHKYSTSPVELQTIELSGGNHFSHNSVNAYLHAPKPKATFARQKHADS
jgi:hypothetical protein